MTDKELLELAAKAAGIEVRYQPITHRFLYEKDWRTGEGKYFAYWEPLTDDGDALRLAVKLNIAIRRSDKDDASYAASPYGPPPISEIATDPYAATRRAIVRAAAEIGKGMK
jgi:hypothetical protein